MNNIKDKSPAKRRIEESLEDASEYLQDRAVEQYDKALDRLQYEKDRMERELKHEYRNARRYVRANPEQGVGIAFIAGLIFGILLTRSGK